jgi:hypothetical protein
MVARDQELETDSNEVTAEGHQDLLTWRISNVMGDWVGTD